MARKNQVTDSPSNVPLPWEGAAFVGLLGVLVLWQGGYYAAASCVVGLLAAGCAAFSAIVSARARGRRDGSIAISLLIAGVGACSLASSAVHGLTLTGVAESAPWFAVAALAFLHAVLPDAARARTMRAVVWLGVAIAVLGLALMSMPGGVEGAVNAGRLQFPFQYANTSGTFFAACALLALGSENARLRRAASFPLAALLFTQSAGACGLFACALVALCACRWREGAFVHVAEAAALTACAAGAFVLCLVVGTGWALAAAAGAFAAGSLAVRRLARAKNARRTALFACALLVACTLACVEALAQTGRAAQAGRTFVERLVQMGDAAAVVAANPALGIGPDVWRFLYPYVQSAQYTATSVHCGYLQIALDAGLAGAALFVAAIVVGVKRTASCGNAPVVCAILLIAVHGAFDIDFQFAALLAFLAMLLTLHAAPEPRRRSRSLDRAWGLPLALLFLAASFAASGFGLWAASAKDASASAAAKADAAAIRQVLEQNPLAKRDDSVRSDYAEALRRAGAWSELAKAFSEDSIASAEQALYAAEALYAFGDDARAEDILLAELEREPGNVDLFVSARLLLASHDAGEEARERYRQAAARANAMASTGLAALIGNQEQLPETLA